MNHVPSATSSRFWDELSAEHRAQLDELGLTVFKRVQALRYFTWRWRPFSLWRSEQLRYLLKATGPREWARALAPPIALRRAQWAPTGWSLGERLLTTFAVRLAWAVATEHGDPEMLALEEPEFGAPLPIRARGRLIAQDLANTALEMASIRAALAGRAPSSIVEIGAGYGRNAHALLSLFPEARYTIVDIEPAATISRWYLEQLFGPARLTFLAPDELAIAPESAFDLGLSVSSLQEMRLGQVSAYLAELDRTVGGVVYLKQWTTWHNSVDDVTLRFDDYPVPDGWRRVLQRPAPIQTSFTEAAWETRPDR